MAMFPQFKFIRSFKLLNTPNIGRNVNTLCPPPYVPVSSFTSGSGSILWSSPTQPDIQGLPKALNILRNAYKIRINQLRLKRIGLKAAKEKCIREFEVVDTLNGDEKLLFIRLNYAMDVAKYEMSVFAYSSSQDKDSEKVPTLIKMNLERNKLHKTIAAKIYSPPERPIAYIYDLEGVHRTAIIEDGARKKSLYQFHTNNPSGWNNDAKIYSGRGNIRLGHFCKLTEGYNKQEIMIYLRLHHELDILSKCIIMGAALFLMSYDYVR